MEFILTQKGKEYLSEGKFNIKFYAFSDDEIDYQVKSGFSGSR